jgi:quinoprotein glucose dehydrogenase
VRRLSQWIMRVAPVACFLWATIPAGAQSVVKMPSVQNGEWPTYGGDLASNRYSPLDQINAGNFNKLEVAWRFKADFLGPRAEYKFEATPLMVHGVVYSTFGTRRAVIALDASTGEMLWMHSENEGERGEAAPRKLSGRGLAYWTDGREERILYVTPGYRLIALDARTGILAPGFGKNGVVDLRQDDDQDMDLINADIGLHAAPVVAKDVIIVGAAHLSGSFPKSKKNIKGYVRGFDVRTGKRLWIFHTIPLPGEYGYDSWLNGSAAYTGNAGVWAQISVDEQLGLVYLPVELPTGDYFGADRPGNGLFGESLVAVDLQTGKRKWHYQLVHHGLWDMDIPAAPILADITVSGKPVKVVAQPTKQGFLYVFNRETGEPIWPIVERPVTQGDTPGEWYSRTQPFPTKPPPYDNQGVSVDKLIDFTPELHAKAEKLIEQYRVGPLFSPPSVSNLNGTLATIASPGQLGSANWPGGSYDPETHTVYLFSQTQIAILGLVHPPAQKSDLAYYQGLDGNRPEGRSASAGEGGGFTLAVDGLPLLKPPYGRITAINLDKGDITWQIAHGETPDYIRNNPALKGVTIPRTGQSGIIGVLTTKSLVIAGEPSFTITSSGARGAMLRAYDKATGKEVGAVYMPAPQSGSPMTYTLNGKQYVVVAVSGASYSDELIAFGLPSN